MSVDIVKELGARVRAKRTTMGLTQESLSTLSGLSPQVISNSENGSTAIRPENLIKLCRALDVSADYLLTGETVDKDILIAHQKMQQLSAEQFNDLMRIIELFIKNVRP